MKNLTDKLNESLSNSGNSALWKSFKLMDITKIKGEIEEYLIEAENQESELYNDMTLDEFLYDLAVWLVNYGNNYTTDLSDNRKLKKYSRVKVKNITNVKELVMDYLTEAENQESEMYNAMSLGDFVMDLGIWLSDLI